jgi:hypothetical protein
MKLQFERKDFLKALHRAASVGNRLEMHPFFGSCLIVSRDKKTGITICQMVEVDGELDDVIGCELYPIKNYIANVGGDTVSINVGARLSVKIDAMKPVYFAREVGASRFAQYEDVPDSLSEVDGADLVNLTKIGIIGESGAAGFHGAVFFVLGREKLEAFSTNGFSMANAWASKSSEGWNGEDIVLPVPVGIVQSLSKMYWEGDISIGYKENKVFFDCSQEGFWVYAPLLNVQKPVETAAMLRKLFEAKSNRFVYADPEQLKTWIGVCGSLHSTNDFFAVQIDYDPIGEISIQNTDNDRGLIQHTFSSMNGGVVAFSALVSPKLAQQGQALVDAIANDITGIKLVDSEGQGHVLFMEADGGNVQFALAKMAQPK